MHHSPTRGRSQQARVFGLTGLAVLSVIAASCGRSPSATSGEEIPAVKVGYFSGALVSLPALVAERKGFFKSSGLDVTLVPVPNGPAMTSGVASGSLDFVNNSYDNLAVAVQKKLPVKAVVGNTTRVPFKLIVNKGVPLPHASSGYPDVVGDLVGRRWGVIALGVSLQYLDEALLTKSGHAKDDVTFIAVGLGDSARAALKNGTVDTYIATEPLPAIAQATGEATVAVDLVNGEGPEEFSDLDYNGWWASEKTLESSRETVEKFVKANQDAYCWYSDPGNFDDLLALMKKAAPVPALNDEQYATMLKESLPGFGVDIKDSSLQTWQELLKANGQVSDIRGRDDLVAADAPTGFTCP